MKIDVAPLVGARIEISVTQRISFVTESLPSWERGLKLICDDHCSCCNSVAPLVGARIEITKLLRSFSGTKSLPSWERGLKSVSTEEA